MRLALADRHDRARQTDTKDRPRRPTPLKRPLAGPVRFRRSTREVDDRVDSIARRRIEPDDEILQKRSKNSEDGPIGHVYHSSVPPDEPWEWMDEMKPHDPKHWDAVAEDYASASEPITRPYGLDALAALGPRPGLRYLEAAAGTGAVALEAARSGCDVTATDASPAMVARLASRAAEEGLANVTALVMDGQALDLPDASFDLACSVFGVMFFPDHRAGLSELRRALAPGGKAAVVVWSTPDRMGHLSAWRDVFRADFPEFGDLERPAAWRAMETDAGLAAEMESTGFRSVEVRALRHAWVVPSSAWRPEGGRCHPFFERILARLRPDALERARGRLAAGFDERYGDGPATFPAEAWLAIGRR